MIQATFPVQPRRLSIAASAAGCKLMLDGVLESRNDVFEIGRQFTTPEGCCDAL